MCNAIINRVCKNFHVTRIELLYSKGQSYVKGVKTARAACAVLLRKTGLSLHEIQVLMNYTDIECVNQVLIKNNDNKRLFKGWHDGNF